MAWIRYVIFLLILVIPAAVVDDVIGGITSAGWRYVLRILWILIVFAVLRLIPPPQKE